MKYKILYEHSDGSLSSKYEIAVESELDLESPENNVETRILALRDSAKYKNQGIGSVRILSVERIGTNSGGN